MLSILAPQNDGRRSAWYNWILMSNIFVALGMISGALTLAGCVWSVVMDVRARKVATIAAEDALKESPASAEQDAVAGAADRTSTGGEEDQGRLGFSFAGVGCRVRSEGWRAALPWLLVAIGLLALLVFGALALLTSLPSKVFGVAAAAIAAYVAATELRSFRKAARGQDK
jgi:hypothetical protein